MAGWSLFTCLTLIFSHYPKVRVFVATQRFHIFNLSALFSPVIYKEAYFYTGDYFWNCFIVNLNVPVYPRCTSIPFSCTQSKFIFIFHKIFTIFTLRLMTEISCECDLERSLLHIIKMSKNKIRKFYTYNSDLLEFLQFYILEFSFQRTNKIK